MRKAAWAVPAAAVLAVAGAIVLPQASDAAPPDLPALSAQEVLTHIAEADPVPLSGTTAFTANLGLPDLSALDSLVPTAASPQSLITGTHTIKVWFDPQVGARADIEGERSEYAVIANTSDVWTYSSADNAATRTPIPADAPSPAATVPPTDIPTPDVLAGELLTALEPSTTVTVDSAVRVAGRDCYQLVLTPKDAGTLVGSVRLAVDAKTWVPLQAQVWSVQDTKKPALNAEFTAVSFATPATSYFDFTPPPGTTVQDVPLPTGDVPFEHPTGTPGADMTSPVVSGSGWAAIVHVPASTQLTAALGGALSGESPSDNAVPGDVLSGNPAHGGSLDAQSLDQLLSQLGTTVSNGTVYGTNLFSVLVTDDGQVFAGLVPPAAVEAAAAG